jgi:hypothetical protein
MLPSLLRAVIIIGGDGLGNTTAPVGDQGWAYVGKINTANSTATYLGNDWFITAWHVRHYDNPTAVTLNGTPYTVDSGTWTRLSNVDGDSDLGIFKVTSTVAQPNAVIASSAASVGQDVTMIGHGRDRAVSPTLWYVDTTPVNWVWQESNFAEADATVGGYKWGTNNGTKRWGTNELSHSGQLVSYSFGPYTATSRTFRTTFDNNGDPNEAQGATFDSGGGAFIWNGSTWVLSGIMITVGGYNSQPGSTSIIGNTTYMADLSYYYDQIIAVTAIPELSSLLMALVVLSTGLVFGKIRRESRRRS